MNFYNSNETINQNISSGEVEIRKVANTLWRGKWIILLCIIFFIFITSFYFNRVVIPFYSATAKVALEEGQQRKILTDIESVEIKSLVTDVVINTELEILRSGDLIEKLVDLLNLSNQATFNPHLREPTFSNWILTSFYRFFGTSPNASKLNVFPEVKRSDVINSVRKSITFSNTKNTMVINITVITNDFDLSVLMANTMAKLYIKSKIQLKMDSLKSATDFLSIRTSELKSEFEILKSELTNFSSQIELVNPDVLEAQKIQLRDLRIRLLNTRQIVLEANDRRATLQSLKKYGNLDALIKKANDFRLSRAIAQYRNKKISLQRLNLDVDRFMIEIDAEVERKHKQLLALEESATALESQIALQSYELDNLQQLERETDAARILYDSFFTRLHEMNVQMGLESADGRFFSNAIKNEIPITKKSQMVYLAAVIGFIIGASIVLFWEWRFSGYRSINELNEDINQSVLASLPLIPVENRKTIISYLKNKPNSVFSEAVRNLRTSILMLNKGQAPQIIMLTSSVPKEGKTLLTFALAKSMAGLGKRILLIEADIRRQIYSVNFNREKTINLIDVLTGDINFKDINPFVEELGFDILTSSKSDINAADLFASQNYSNLIAELRKHYDYILIDTPPVLSVPDARIIGANSDANIYIVEWNKTTQAQVVQGFDMFSSIGVDITGFVLNQINPYKIKNYGYISPYGYNAYGSEYYES
ncbi:polysaccharide biosynthesis tyrosine autokinase [Amylibacter sp.]|nr:polysaccharide biosynthesis tyrosine autokinase [Amylibacter sp.]